MQDLDVLAGESGLNRPHSISARKNSQSDADGGVDVSAPETVGTVVPMLGSRCLRGYHELAVRTPEVVLFVLRFLKVTDFLEVSEFFREVASGGPVLIRFAHWVSLRVLFRPFSDIPVVGIQLRSSSF